MVVKPCVQVTFVDVSPDDKLLNEKEQKKVNKALCYLLLSPPVIKDPITSNCLKNRDESGFYIKSLLRYHSL